MSLVVFLMDSIWSKISIVLLIPELEMFTLIPTKSLFLTELSSFNGCPCSFVWFH